MNKLFNDEEIKKLSDDEIKTLINKKFNNKKELKMKVNNNEKTKYYTYEYEGVWSIYDEETREHKRDETIPFDVICEYTPKVWDKMEDDYDDEFSEIISECYSEVMVDFDDETEYHEGNEDYWRVKCIG